MQKKVSEVSKRYAQSLFEIAKEKNKIEETLEEIRGLQSVFSEKEIHSFFSSPMVSVKEKKSLVDQVNEKSKTSDWVKGFLNVLSDKNRVSEFENIVSAYEAISDEEHKVLRGTVKSATILSPEQRTSIEKKVTEFTNKKVILNYIVDKNVIGGLVAEVGSFTFDDTITTHLNRLKEELNRSTH